MTYQKPDHRWGPGTVVHLEERTASETQDDQPHWFRALKGLGIILGLLTGGILLFVLYVIVDGAWIQDS